MQRINQLTDELLWPLLAMSLGIVVLAVIIYAIRSWYHDGEGNADDGLGMLVEYREMVRRGELSEEEYRFIKSRVVSRVQSASPQSKSVNSQAGIISRTAQCDPMTGLAITTALASIAQSTPAPTPAPQPPTAPAE
jgi:hypothetical protein